MNVGNFLDMLKLSDTDKIINIFKDNKWLSKYKHDVYSK